LRVPLEWSAQASDGDAWGVDAMCELRARAEIRNLYALIPTWM
jgi:hypothetical protein